MGRIFTSSKDFNVVRTPYIQPQSEDDTPVADRQERVPGFSQAKLSSSSILMAGAGGLGSEIGEGLVRKGVGELLIADDDNVALSDLSRQLYYRKDLGKNKAESLVANLHLMGAMGSELAAYPSWFNFLVEDHPDLPIDCVVVAVDNDDARVEAAQYCLKRSIPAVFTGLSMDATHGYVFVQEPGKACWACLFPGIAAGERIPCDTAAAVKDLCKTISGLALYGIDSVLMDRPRAWNYRSVSMDGAFVDATSIVPKREDCIFCGSQ